MNTNEWHSWHSADRRPSHRQPYRQDYQPRPSIPEITLNEKFIEEERKIFAIALKQNVHGRFLRITEDKNGRRSTVIVPVSALEDLQTVINEMVATNKSLPIVSEEVPPASNLSE